MNTKSHWIAALAAVMVMGCASEDPNVEEAAVSEMALGSTSGALSEKLKDKIDKITQVIIKRMVERGWLVGCSKCDDGNTCTEHYCGIFGGCWTLYVDDGKACDDGSACTTDDICKETVCVGAPISCDDGDPCTDDACDTASGCGTTPNTGAACDDGSVCTEFDTCQDGSCGGKAVICDDGDPCTDDVCDALAGCGTTPNTGASCDDGSACTQFDTCLGGACGGKTIVCDDNNPCTDDACDPATGCTFTANTEPCDDGDACTTADTCSEGECVGGPAPVEVCDGVDNNCDGTTDEGFGVGDWCFGDDVCGEDACGADGFPTPCTPLGTVACAADGGTMCAPAPCQLALLWQVGSFDFGCNESKTAEKGAAEFPANNAYSESFTYDVSGKGDAAAAIPSYLFHKKAGFKDGRPLTDAAKQVNFVFTVNSDVEGAVAHWSRYGSEVNDLLLDGVVLLTTQGTENVNDTYEVPLPTLTAGEHTLSVAYKGGGNNGGNYLDALRVVAPSCSGEATSALAGGAEMCGNGLDDDCDCEVDEGYDVGESCDPCGDSRVNVYGYSNDETEAPVIVGGQGFILSGSTFADMFEHSYSGADAYVDHFLDLLLVGTDSDVPTVLGFYGAYDAGDVAGMHDVLESFQDQGFVSSYCGMDVSVGQPLDITETDLEGVDVVVLDAAPDAPSANFFVLTKGALDALTKFMDDGGIVIASAYTMVHWTNYYGWQRELANTDLAALFGGVVPDIQFYADSATTMAPLAGGLVKTLNYAKPNLSTNKNPYFHFFWGLDLSNACTAPMSTKVCGDDGYSTVCQ